MEEGEVNKPIILDCRNKYETGVGRFVGAEPLETEVSPNIHHLSSYIHYCKLISLRSAQSFRESFDVIKERLKDVPKDQPIMSYCTGGIRCVKVGAYLTQELGMTNVSRLAGGIIAYDRSLQPQPEKQSLFKGTNYVFDHRVGRTITDDLLGVCVTCAAPAGKLSNCNNNRCHKRMVQCESCSGSFLGCCGGECRVRFVNSKIAVDPDPLTLENYAQIHTSKPSKLLSQIAENTKNLFPSGAHMVSSDTQGRLLSSLAGLTGRCGRILEIGTFTGYASICLAEGLASSGGGYVLSLERDDRSSWAAREHLKAWGRGGGGDRRPHPERGGGGRIGGGGGGGGGGIFGLYTKLRMRRGRTCRLV